MKPSNDSEQKLLEKIKRLPPEKAAEFEDFVDFLSQRESEREESGVPDSSRSLAERDVISRRRSLRTLTATPRQGARRARPRA